MFEANLVVYAGVIHQRIQTAKLFDGFLNGFAAVLRRREFGYDDAAGLQLRAQLLRSFRITIKNHGDCTFGTCSTGNCTADSLSASGDQDYLIF